MDNGDEILKEMLQQGVEKEKKDRSDICFALGCVFFLATMCLIAGLVAGKFLWS